MRDPGEIILKHTSIKEKYYISLKNLWYQIVHTNQYWNLPLTSAVSSTIEFSTAITWVGTGNVKGSFPQNCPLVLYNQYHSNHWLGHPHVLVTWAQIGNFQNLLLKFNKIFDGSQNSWKHLNSIYWFIGKDITKDTHEQLTEKVPRVRYNRVVL